MSKDSKTYLLVLEGLIVLTALFSLVNNWISVGLQNPLNWIFTPICTLLCMVYRLRESFSAWAVGHGVIQSIIFLYCWLGRSRLVLVNGTLAGKIDIFIYILLLFSAIFFILPTIYRFFDINGDTLKEKW